MPTSSTCAVTPDVDAAFARAGADEQVPRGQSRAVGRVDRDQLQVRLLQGGCHLWARVAAQFVKPGGFFYVTEIHPVAQVFDDDDGVTELRLRYPYFSHDDPMVFKIEGSYADRTAKVAQDVEYGWNHGLGEIVTSLVKAGLRIEFLHEFPFNEWPVSFLEPAADGTYRLPPENDGRLPLFFSLKASKPAP